MVPHEARAVRVELLEEALEVLVRDDVARGAHALAQLLERERSGAVLVHGKERVLDALDLLRRRRILRHDAPRELVEGVVVVVVVAEGGHDAIELVRVPL